MNRPDLADLSGLSDAVDPAATLADTLRRRVRGNEGGEKVEVMVVDGGVASATVRVLIGVWPETRLTPAPETAPDHQVERPEDAERALLATARREMESSAFTDALAAALREDPWRALGPFSGEGMAVTRLDEQRLARLPCEACGGLGQAPVDDEESEGGVEPCPECAGAGWRKHAMQVEIMLAGAVALAALSNAPEGAEDVVRRGLADLIERRAFAPELSAFETGAAPAATLVAPLPVAFCRVIIGRKAARRVYDVWAIGEPLEFVDPPPLLDLLHEYALDKIMVDPIADKGALADQLAATRIGRAALRAAAAFEPQFDADDIAFADATGSEGDGAAAKTLSAAKLVSRTLTDRLFRFAQQSYRELGDSGRRTIWLSMLLLTPIVAMTLTGMGYVGGADSLLANLDGLVSLDLREALTIVAWAAPFLLFWLAALWASILHFRMRTKRVIGRALGFGATDALRQARRPWIGLALGGMLYGLAFIGSAPPDEDRIGMAEETQLLARFRIPILNSVFDGAADGRDWIAASLGVDRPASRPDLEELRGRVVSRQSLLAERLRTVAYAARPDRWGEFDGVAAVKALGPSGVAVFGVLCAQGAPIFTLVAEPLAELSRVSLFVNRISLPDAVARNRDGAVSWPATQGALSAVRSGVALRAVVDDLSDDGGTLLYDFTLAESAARVADATRGCRR